MSALARYFLQENYVVGGYDKTPSPLTEELKKEGADVHYVDLGSNLSTPFNDPKSTLIVYTPAIPKEMGELQFVMNAGFTVKKRAEVLGMITGATKALAVAGTHGKTTTSTMLAHVLNNSELKCNAFLGGISSNYNSNYIGNKEAEFTVVEADEFDRSFLRLSPYASIITSTDADHLDIYQDDSTFLEGFKQYVDKIDKQGFLVCHDDVRLQHEHTIVYGQADDSDYRATRMRYNDGVFSFDVVHKEHEWKGVELGIPGIHNAENATAVIAMCREIGMTEDKIRNGLKTFKGVKRRFEYIVRGKDRVYIDDYAHHPTELKALISSVRLLYPDRKITGIFQPHLYSRTRDFFNGFADELSTLDEVILMPIYPARELPIPGITSDKLLESIRCKNKSLLTPQEVLSKIEAEDTDVLLTIGAGDIDRLVPELRKIVEAK